jgi:Tol biopolymer transport system component
MISEEEQLYTPARTVRTVPIAVEEVEPALVAHQLKLIVSSPEFYRSERMSSFLTEVIRATLAQEKGKLTERSIGETVFGKESGWDPRSDTIVRSEARRLRRKLREFYDGQGRNSTFLIDLPLGSYMATFALLEMPASQEVPLPIGLQSSVSAPAASARPEQKRHLPWLATLGFAIAATALVFWGLRHGAKSGVAEFRIAPFADEIGEEYSPSVSPNDQVIAYVWDGNVGKPNIYLKNTDGSHRVQFTSGEGDYFLPAWSPDGNGLSYLRLQDQHLDLMVRSLKSGEERVVSNVRREMGRWSSDSGPLLGNIGPEWSRDGGSIYIADRQFSDGGVGGVYRIEVASGARMQVTSAPGEQRDFSPRVSPDGHTLAFVRYFSHGHGELFTVPVTGGTPTQLTSDVRDIQGITWSKDGESLIFCSNRSSYFQLWSITATGGAPVLLPTNTTSATNPFAFHHSGRMGFVDSSENWNIWRYTIEQGRLGSKTLLISSSGRNHDPRFSPDGKRIAFISDRSGTFEIWVVDADGSQPKQLTHVNGAWLNSLSWSPDGKTIAFDARPRGHAAIYSIPVNGGDMTILDDTAVEQRMPGWASNRKSIYFNSVRDGAVAIYLKDLIAGTIVRVSEHEMYTVAESPDGRALYYSDRSGRLFGANPDGSGARPLNITAFPVKSWAATPRGLVYSRQGVTAGTFEICIFDSGRVTVLGTAEGPLVGNDPDVSLSSDGKWLLVAQQDQMRSDIKIRIP